MSKTASCSSDDDKMKIFGSSYLKESKCNSNSGVIRFKVDNVSTLDKNGRYSPEIEVGGVLWRMRVVRKNTDGNEVVASYLYVRHNNMSRLWSIDVRATFILINSDYGKAVRQKFDNRTYKYRSTNWGTDCLLAWNDLMDEEKGFINDNSITVEVRFDVVDFEGFRRFREVSFTDRNESLHDVILVIDGKKIHVSKQILAIHSPVFNAMFYGQFDEKDKKEIELKDVDREDFIEMLNLIYPSYQKITDANVECILSIADRFQIQSVIDQGEQFYIESSNIDVNSKLEVSNAYRLVKLQEHCLGWFERKKRCMNQEDIDSFIADNIVKIETTTQIDFTDANDPRHDIGIVFNKGEKVYACKKYITLHFMQFAKIDEVIWHALKEIKMEEIDREEFLEMLRVIYPTGQKITDENVKFLVKLGNRFEIKYLLDLIESHLISSPNLELAAKLLLSDKYKLINLQVHCFNIVNDLDDLEYIKDSGEYEELSDATKVALLEKIFRFPR